MSLIPRFVYGDLDLTEWPFAVEFGSDFGNPENVVDVVGSMLADGEVLESNRRTNRTLTIRVLIDGADLAALADAEAQLIAEADRQRNTLSVDPGDGFGVTTVFETFRAQPRWTRDDDEEQNGVRRILLEIPAQPHPRSVGLVTDDAGTPPSSGGTVVESCESTTGWAAFNQGVGGGWVSPAFSVDGAIFSEGTGSIKSLMTQWEEGRVTGGGMLSPAQGTSRDEITGLSIATGTGGYLSVAVRGEPANQTTVETIWTSTAAGVWVEVPSWTTVQRDANGFVHYAWPVDADLTIVGLRFEVKQYRSSDNVPRPYTWYDEFELLPSATTDNQIVKQLTVEGSARTIGSLRIAAPVPSIALGQVLAITAPTDDLPAGFTPDARRWAVQGTTTVDATALGGSYYTPDAATYSTSTGKPIFDVPVGMLTAGPYTIVALVRSAASPVVFGVQAQLRPDGTNVGPTSAAEVSIPSTSTTWQFVTVGTVYLPPLPMQNASTAARVRLLFKGATFADVYMIPAWQSGGRAVADFSIVDCGTGTVSSSGASSSLWIDSPSIEQTQGGWWRGPTDDRMDARSAWPDARKRGLHSFKPGGLTAFVISLAAQGPTLTLDYYPSWFGNAAS